MPSLAPDYRIQFIPRGITTSRGLVVTSGASDLTLSGTYTLTDPSGTVLVNAAAFTNNAYSLSTLSSSATLGGGWWEEWAFTSGGNSYVVKRRVIVTETLDSRYNLVSHNALLAYHPWLADMPSGYSSWDVACEVATREVLQIVADRTAQGLGSDLLNADALALPALHIAVRNICTAGAALTGNPNLLATAGDAQASADDWFRRAKLQFDADGDGDADRTDTMAAQAVGFPPPSPTRV